MTEMKPDAAIRFGLCAVLCAAMGQAPAASRPLVGAIRWDAWHGDRGEPGKAVQRSLGAKKWHDRLPFYAEVLDRGRVRIDASAQEVMDREIEYAARAGLDYWAFVTYPRDDPMSLGLQRYLSSRVRGKIGFCLVTECGRWGDPKYVQRLAALMRERGYQTVLAGRPLLYVGFITEDKLRQHWRGAKGFRRVLDGLRQTAVRSGLKDPYVVIMDFSAAQGKRWLDALGADAVSSYAVSAGGKGAPYAHLARAAEAFWDRCRATGAQVVPVVMAGWDRRPRVERPVPWEKSQRPGEGIEKFYLPPQPAELAGHLRNALGWLQSNAASAAAQTALIYAWNENDEGGWLVPTRKADGSADTTRVEALAGVLRPEPVRGLTAARRLAAKLPCRLRVFRAAGREAFVMLPKQAPTPTPWVWYAPTMNGHPDPSHTWMFTRWLAKGIAVAGIDVGESYGSPEGRRAYSALYETLVKHHGLAARACLLPQSRGGLMLYNWAVENPTRVACIAGIYTVCDLRSYPGLRRACGAYNMTERQLADKIADHNPVDCLAPLARAGVPILHIHGDSDSVVPLEKNAAELARRYRKLGGAVKLIVVPNRGHQVCPEFFQRAELVDFVITHARPQAEDRKIPALPVQ